MTDKPERVTESVVEALRVMTAAFAPYVENEAQAEALRIAAAALEALTTRSQPGEDAVAIVREFAGRRTTRETLTGIVGEAYLPANGAREADRLILRARAALNAAALPVEEVRDALPLLFYDSDSRAFRLASLIAFLRGQAADGRMSVRNVALLADDIASLTPSEDK